MAFRDDFGGQATANQFSQHVGVAEDFLDRIEGIPRRLDGLERGDGITQELMDHFAREWAKGWQDAWDQLQQARDLVAKKGRDTSGYDAARAAAGDIYVDVAVGKAVRAAGEVHVSWRNVPTTTAREAIAALRAAMPEVVVVKHPPLEVDLSPTSHKLVGIVQALLGFAVLGAIGYGLYRLATG